MDKFRQGIIKMINEIEDINMLEYLHEFIRLQMEREEQQYGTDEERIRRNDAEGLRQRKGIEILTWFCKNDDFTLWCIKVVKYVSKDQNKLYNAARIADSSRPSKTDTQEIKV